MRVAFARVSLGYSHFGVMGLCCGDVRKDIDEKMQNVCLNEISSPNS